jgi:pentatricopeptide repeat protein
LHTGGIDSEIIITPNLKNPNQYELSLLISSYCLERNIEKMIDIIELIHLTAKVGSNPQHLKNLIEQFLYEMSSDVISNGSSFANLNSASFITKTDVFQFLINFNREY